MKAVSLPMMGLLILAPIMISAGQVLFKLTSEKLEANNAPFYAVFYNPLFLVALVIYGSATLLWLYVLKTVPLSYAYSFMALTFVIVPILAIFFLGESVNLKYVLGAALIISGLVLTHAG